MDMPVENPRQKARDFMYVDALQPTSTAQNQRPIIVLDAGHGWLPDAKDPTKPDYDSGALYNPNKDDVLSKADRKNATHVVEATENAKLAHIIGQELERRGFEVVYTNLHPNGELKWTKDHFPPHRIQSRLDVALALKDAGKPLVGYITVHHDSGFKERQSGAAIAMHYQTQMPQLAFGKAIAARVHSPLCLDNDIPVEPIVSSRQRYIDQFGNPASDAFSGRNAPDESHYDPEQWGEVLPHGANIIRPDANARSDAGMVTRGLEDIPTVLIERGVVWNANDRRKINSIPCATAFAHLVAAGAVDYFHQAKAEHPDWPQLLPPQLSR